MKKEAESLPKMEVQYTQVMSRNLFYPMNTFAAEMASLMRRKSFTKKEIEKFKEMGFTVEITAKTLEIPKQFL